MVNKVPPPSPSLTAPLMRFLQIGNQASSASARGAVLCACLARGALVVDDAKGHAQACGDRHPERSVRTTFWTTVPGR